MALPYSASFPVIAQGLKMPQGTLVGDTLIEDCRVVCREDDKRINLFQFAELVKFDFEQPSPVEAGHLWEQLAGLGVEMVFPVFLWDEGTFQGGQQSEYGLLFPCRG